jgi:dTDP-4-amino-4,6-dideoxygalactose transaminase
LINFVEKRAKIALCYDNFFQNMEVKALLHKEGRNSSNHLYVIRVLDSVIERDKLFSHLRKKNIGVNMHYIPVYRHPYFNSNLRLKGAEEFYQSAITLPIFPTIKQDELKSVTNEIAAFFSCEN